MENLRTTVLIIITSGLDGPFIIKSFSHPKNLSISWKTAIIAMEDSLSLQHLRLNSQFSLDDDISMFWQHSQVKVIYIFVGTYSSYTIEKQENTVNISELSKFVEFLCGNKKGGGQSR